MKIRIAPKISWWEKIGERLWFGERWEYLDNDTWKRFWRRHGALPR